MTMQSKNFQEDLYKNLKRHRGAINEVAQKAGIHRNNVRLILSGRWANEQVVLIAAQVLRERETNRVTFLRQAKAMYSEALAMN